MVRPVNLVNFVTGVVVKNFPAGSQVTVGFKTFTNGQKYYVTRYSATHNTPNGFILEEFDFEEPTPLPPPPVEVPVDPDPIEPTPVPVEPEPHPIPLPDATPETRYIWTQILDWLIKLYNSIFRSGR